MQPRGGGGCKPEQQLQVETAFDARAVLAHDAIALERLFDVQRIVRRAGLELHLQPRGQLIHRGVQEDVAVGEDHHRVDQPFQVMHLMRGDQETALRREVADERAPELTLAREIEPVGRLVHDHEARIGGETERQQEFLLLAV